MMDHYNCFLSCITDAGVTFTMSAVTMGVDAIDAANKAIEHILKHGGQVTLMQGAPPMPVKVAYAVPQRIDKMSAIAIEQRLPTGPLVKM